MKKVICLMMIVSIMCSVSSCKGKDESDAEKSLGQSSVEAESSQTDISGHFSGDYDNSQNDESGEVSVQNNSKYFIKVPDKYKDLAVGKALNSIDVSEGYMFTIQLKDSEHIKYVEKGDSFRIVDSRKSGDNILVADNNTFLVDEENKTYSIAESDIFKRFSFLDKLEHVETTEKEIDGVKYTVDKFSEKLLGSNNSQENTKVLQEVVEFYVSENNLKYIGFNENMFEVSFSFNDIDGYLQIPNDYTQKSLKNVVGEYFTVPEEFKDYRLGKEINSLDIEKGFSITYNVKSGDVEDVIGYHIVFKHSKVYIGQYNESGYVKEIFYKNSKRIVLEGFECSVSRDALGKNLGMSGNFFDGYTYAGTREEDVDILGTNEKLSCYVETFTNKDGKTVDFYFEGEKLFLVVKDGEEIRLEVDSSGNIDESCFERVS